MNDVSSDSCKHFVLSMMSHSRRRRSAFGCEAVVGVGSEHMFPNKQSLQFPHMPPLWKSDNCYYCCCCYCRSNCSPMNLLLKSNNWTMTTMSCSNTATLARYCCCCCLLTIVGAVFVLFLTATTTTLTVFEEFVGGDTMFPFHTRVLYFPCTKGPLWIYDAVFIGSFGNLRRSCARVQFYNSSLWSPALSPIQIFTSLCLLMY